jgi:hypothetical protein
MLRLQGAYKHGVGSLGKSDKHNIEVLGHRYCFCTQNMQATSCHLLLCRYDASNSRARYRWQRLPRASAMDDKWPLLPQQHVAFSQTAKRPRMPVWVADLWEQQQPVRTADPAAPRTQQHAQHTQNAAAARPDISARERFTTCSLGFFKFAGRLKPSKRELKVEAVVVKRVKQAASAACKDQPWDVAAVPAVGSFSRKTALCNA